MSQPAPERLYTLLPSIYRQRDVAQGEPLRALMAVVESELQRLEADLDGLYNNWFIETCDEWVVPYLGDLLGVTGLGDERNAVSSQRARVANAINASRRKGTVPALERLIRDSTGWHAKAVEFFDLLTTTQHIRHIRPGKGGTFDVRQKAVWRNSPFDPAACTPDMHGGPANPGKYNLPNLGVFLCRLRSYPLKNSPARAAAQPDDGRYTFSPTGQDLPLFNQPQTETEPAQATRVVNFPIAIHPEDFERDLALHQHLPGDQENTDYYGPQRSLYIVKVNEDTGGREIREPVPATALIASDLGNWARPPAGKVAVDVRLGRLAFAQGQAPSARAQVSFNYGFSADIGGGSYDRRETLADPALIPYQIRVGKAGQPLFSLEMRYLADLQDGPVPEALRGEFLARGFQLNLEAALEAQANGDQWHINDKDVLPIYRVGKDEDQLKVYPAIDTLQKALNHWQARGKPNAVIQIADNDIYGGNLRIEMQAGARLVIEAADGARPNLRLIGNLEISAPLDGVAWLTFNGLLVEGGLEIVEGNLNLAITHCTLVSGRMLGQDGDALVAKADDGITQVEITRSIVGPLRLAPLQQTAGQRPAGCRKLSIQDSIVDAPKVAGASRPAIAADDAGGFGPATSIERTTVFGTVHITELTLASDVIFTEPVHIESDQGCVRYSYVPLESTNTPARFRCQPDLALAESVAGDRDLVLARLRPRFTSTRYGEPGYAQLSLNCAVEIRSGADQDSEMGAFHHLYQSQREMNLRLVLDETLRLGLQAGIFHIT